MFPQQIMDSFLKLKLDLIYRGLPVAEAEQRFKALKEPRSEEDIQLVKEGAPAIKKRKLRIPAAKK
jgi:hypothetical protein